MGPDETRVTTTDHGAAGGSDRKLSVVVAGGGTAGHIEPALAVADAVHRLDPSARITALGTSRGLETTLVPERGYDLALIPPVPLPRKPGIELAKTPTRLLRSVLATRKVLADAKADVVVGFGGYASAPAYVAASRELGVLPYFPLSPTMLGGIVRLQLNRVVKRVGENHAIVMTYDDAVVDLIVSRCTEVASGGRMIDAILTNTMLPELSIALLERQMGGIETTGIHVGVQDSVFTYRFEPEAAANDTEAAEPALAAAE